VKLQIYLKENKARYIIYVFFYLFLILSLILRNYVYELYPLSIFLVILIFILSQYFSFGYRYFVGFAIILLCSSPFLLISKYERLAEYFTDYTYMFLVLGVIGYFLDNLRDKLRKKGYFKIYRFVFLSLLVLILFLPFIVYRNYIPELPDIIKNANYYVKKESVKLDGLKIEENIIIRMGN